jgi:hypothetical protein
MGNNLTDKPWVDSFEGFQSEEGEEQGGGSVLTGTRRVKFSNDAEWLFADDETEVAADREFLAVDVLRIVQKFVDQHPVDEPIILEPGQKFPDIKALNDAAPKEEWGEDFNGAPCGPWQGQYIVRLLDPATMEKFSFVARVNTIGSTIAVNDLVDRTRWMRRMRGDHVYAKVKLGDVFMNTKYGGRQRPCFVITGWVGFGGGQALSGSTNPALPPANTKEMLDRFAGEAKPAEEPKENSAGLHTIEPPSVAEEVDDEIPSKGSVSETDRNGSRAPAAKRAKNPVQEKIRSRA